MPLSKKSVLRLTSIACATLVLILGVTCLVLGLKGYFTFEDPCVGVESFSIKDIDLESSDGGNAVLGLLDAFTGGRASDLVPTQVTMTIEMILEVNNTNSYDLEYEQKDEGLIEIPGDEGESHPDDFVIGTWEIPSSTLKSKARNEIPVTLTSTIDLLSADAMGLAGDFVSGKAMLFRISGGIEGSSWLPGFSGHSTFLCLANVDSIMDLSSGAEVKCRHSTKAGRIIDESGNLNFLASFDDDDEVDPACLV